MDVAVKKLNFRNPIEAQLETFRNENSSKTISTKYKKIKKRKKNLKKNQKKNLKKNIKKNLKNIKKKK